MTCLAWYSLILYSTQSVSVSDSRVVQSYQDLSLTLAGNLNEGLAHGESCCLVYCICQGWTQRLCCKQGSASYGPLLSPTSPPSPHLPWPHALYDSCGKSNHPANLLSAGQLAARARTRRASTSQLYVYRCLSICSICHMPVPEVSWEEDPSETKLFQQNLKVSLPAPLVFSASHLFSSPFFHALGIICRELIQVCGPLLFFFSKYKKFCVTFWVEGVASPTCLE